MRNLFKISLLTLWALWLTGTCCFADDVALVINNNNPLSSISRRTADLIFHGKKTKWINGEYISVLVNNSQEVYSVFCQKVLKKNPRQYLLYRKKILFTGMGIPPMVKKDDEAVIAFIAKTRNAIGFIDKKSLDSRVKELKIH
ncbi:MAG: hypothetical protein KQH63_17280 [Desulfobulbaceae bacterium]|nr:hypothetical protein [Desulfobulbaceae bacterium]